MWCVSGRVVSVYCVSSGNHDMPRVLALLVCVMSGKGG